MARDYHNPEFRGNKKRRTAWLIFAASLAVLFGIYAYIALNSAIPAGDVSLHNSLITELDAPQLAWPNEGQAAVGTLGDGVLARSHEDEQPRPIASLAKVITALAILEKKPLKPGEPGMTITLDEEDENLFWHYVAKDGTVTAVTPGGQINQYQALQAMLLPSSNNMSDSLVRRVFGSMDAYVDYANEMVQRYGLVHTRVADASGFSPDTVSTPSEMIIIGQKALEHPVLAEIFAQEEAEIPIAGRIPNYNQLLQIEGVTGIKPGVTDEAGVCLLFSAKHTDESGQPVTVIGVVLGIETFGQIYGQSARLLRSAQLEIEQVELIRGGQVVGTYRTPWGEDVNLVAKDSVWSYNVQADVADPEFRQFDIPPAPMANQTVGLIDMGAGVPAEVSVVADSSVQEPPLAWRLTRPLASIANRFK